MPFRSRRVKRRAPSRGRSRSVSRKRRVGNGRGMSAPVATNVGMKMNSGTGTIRVVHGEVSKNAVTSTFAAQPAAATNGFQQVAFTLVTPVQNNGTGLQAQTWPWLAQIAQCYDQHYCRYLIVDYIPFCSSQTSGQFCIGFTPDATCGSGFFSSFTSIMSLESSMAGSLWAPLRFVVPLPALLSPDGWKTVNPYTNSAAAGITGMYKGGLQQFAFGNIICAVNGVDTVGTEGNVTSYGTLKYTYAWDLRAPSQNTAVAGVAEATGGEALSGDDTQHILPDGAPTANQPWGVLADRLLDDWTRGPSLLRVVATSATVAQNAYFGMGNYRFFAWLDGTTLTNCALTAVGSNVTISQNAVVINGAATRAFFACNVTVTEPNVFDFAEGQALLTIAGATYTDIDIYISRIATGVYP